MESYIFLSLLCLSLILGTLILGARHRMSTLGDLRGPESTSFWLGTVSMVQGWPVLGHITKLNDLQVISRSTFIKRRPVNQSLNGCMNMGPLGEFEDVWV